MAFAYFGVLFFGLVVWAGMLWGSIAIIDRANTRNRFAVALVWSAINLAVTLALQQLAFLGLFMALAYLVMSVKTLSRYYELGIFQTAGVIGLMIAAPYLLTPPLLNFVGTSELRGILALFGLPLGILGIWVWGRRRAKWQAAREGLPEARVVRVAARPAGDEAVPAARPEPARPAPLPQPARAPVVTPSVPVVVVAAPPPPPATPVVAEPPASPSEGPRFLR